MMMMMMMMMMRLLDGGQMPKADPAMKTSQYVRDRSQNHLLGIFDEELQQVREEEDEDQAAHGIFRERKKKSKRNNPTLAFEKKKAENEDLAGAALENEVLTFGTNCPSCNAPCETNMKVTSESPRRRFVFVLFCFVFPFFLLHFGPAKKNTEPSSVPLAEIEK